MFQHESEGPFAERLVTLTLSDRSSTVEAIKSFKTATRQPVTSGKTEGLEIFNTYCDVHKAFMKMVHFYNPTVLIVIFCVFYFMANNNLGKIEKNKTKQKEPHKKHKTACSSHLGDTKDH